MRVLGVTETCDLGAMYLSLQAEGHEVRVAVSEPLAQGTLAGLCPRTPDWRAELDWVRAAGPDGLVLFESVSEGFGALQDALRADGFNVIGGSAYGDRLETDRFYAQQLLGELGFPLGHVWTFPDPQGAIDFIAARPGRYVLKYSGADNAGNYVGLAPDGRDVAALLRARAGGGAGDGGDIVLMAFIEGVEMGVGAYFNGERFLRPACLDWEHKRFFTGDLGELTGEMGTVVTYERTEAFFARTLLRLESRLRAHGHVGYVNLNCIVNDAGIWPLEFSCRFGYPGYAILAPLQRTSWGALLKSMIARDAERFEAAPGFCVGVVLTVPPFPYSRHQVDEAVGLPVLIDPAVDPAHVHYGEVGLDASGQLVTSGLYGWTLVVTGDGAGVAEAKAAAYARIRSIGVPNLRYRLDIGDRLLNGQLAQIERLGFLAPHAAETNERL
jgi:phosphoribosylamine--glycine ligase